MPEVVTGAETVSIDGVEIVLPHADGTSPPKKLSWPLRVLFRFLGSGKVAL